MHAVLPELEPNVAQPCSAELYQSPRGCDDFLRPGLLHLVKDPLLWRRLLQPGAGGFRRIRIFRSTELQAAQGRRTGGASKAQATALAGCAKSPSICAFSVFCFSGTLCHEAAPAPLAIPCSISLQRRPGKPRH